MPRLDSVDNIDPRIGLVLGGRWVLERLLGTGVTAGVYAAKCATGERAAVKLLFAHMATDHEVLRRFEQEARLVSELNHPGIVKILDHDIHSPEGAYIAFELLEGETLAQRAERQPLEVDQLLDIAEQITDALAVAHDHGVVHRDLKPSNVFLTSAGEVKVLDFGVARVTNGSGSVGTQFGMAIGTVAYMAPEQALGRHDSIDGRTDLFSLGAMLFRLLSGRAVHEAASAAETLQLTATKPAPSLATLCPGLSPEVVAVVDMSLGFAQSARYPNARAMQKDLAALKAGQPSSVASQARARRELDTVRPRMAPDTEGARAATLLDMLGGQETVAPQTSLPEAAGADEDGALGAGTVIAGRYRIDGLLGSGGMGRVYRATHVHMKKTVALKLLHRAMTTLPEVVARFEREAVAAARIEHPNVAGAKDFGKLPDGSFYLVLEYVEGMSLRQMIRRERSCSPERAAVIVAQVASALETAHRMGIVHRDLKPENIMLLARAGAQDCVKVLDFGIAKLTREETATEPQLTQLGTVFGTPDYMSPEQALGSPVDHKSDVYSLGIILYELLCGKTPFAKGDMMAVLTAHLTQAPPPLPSSVPPELSRFTELLLKKQATERPTAAEVRARLAGFGALPEADAAGAGPALATSHGGMHERLRSQALELWQRFTRVLEPRLHALGLRWPVGLVLAVALGSVLSGVLLVLLVAAQWGDDPSRAASPEAHSAGTTQPGALPRSAAEGGLSRVPEATAKEVTRIRALPVYKRTYDDWLALAHTTASMGEFKESTLAYQAVLSLKGSMREDPRLLKDMYRAARDEESFALVVNLCATRLKQPGIDLLFKLWLEFRNEPARAEHAELLGKKLVVLSRRASKELRAAIELETGETCAKLDKAVERASKNSDTRSVPRLSALAKLDGCGSARQDDCYPCLRHDQAVERALAKAKTRPAPSLW